MTEYIKADNVLAEYPAEAQVVEATKLLTTVHEAEVFFNLDNQKYDVPILLTCFETQFYSKIKNRKTNDLRQLTDAKNILLRNQVEMMIEKKGMFNLDNIIPFENVCVSCKGTGERYKFFRFTMPVNCKFCDTEIVGKRTVKCRSCHGTGKYGIHNCTTCQDPNTKESSGYVRIKCRHCRGTGIYHKLVIDSKIKSTTHCRRCKGRGFIQPEKERKNVTPANPVISENLGQQIKKTVISSK